MLAALKGFSSSYFQTLSHPSRMLSPNALRTTWSSVHRNILTSWYRISVFHLLFLKILLFVYVQACAQVPLGVKWCRVPLGSFEPPDVGAGEQTWFLHKSSECFNCQDLSSSQPFVSRANSQGGSVRRSKLRVVFCGLGFQSLHTDT